MTHFARNAHLLVKAEPIPRPKGLFAKAGYVIWATAKQLLRAFKGWEQVPTWARLAILLALLASPVLVAMTCTFCFQDGDTEKEEENLRPELKGSALMNPPEEKKKTPDEELKADEAEGFQDEEKAY